MTALEQFVRLEALGQWRENAKAEPREVVVSFGNATLMLRDIDDQALGHWSLQATQILRRDESGVTYATDPRAEETLHIADFEMIRAIAAVTAAQTSLPATNSNSLRWLGLSFVAALVGAAVWYGPDLLRKQAAISLPPAQALQIGQSILAELESIQGPVCANAENATQALMTRLFTDPLLWKLRVLNLSGRPSASLPGGFILIDTTLLDTLQEPDELAGYVALETVRGSGQAALTAILAEAPLTATLGLFLRGKLDATLTVQVAKQILADTAMPAPRYDFAAHQLLAKAKINTAPFSSAMVRAGVSYERARGFDIATAGTSPALDDQQWVALQNICEE